MLSSCNPDMCVSPPCHRCYPGQLLASRGYVRTSVSGELTSAAVAENCHNFKICLPWIQDVQADIKVTTIPNFENNFVITRVAFSCFDVSDLSCMQNPDKAWVVVIKSTVNYPWYVKEVSSGSGRLGLGDVSFDLISIENLSGCNQPGEHCEQIFTYNIPKCNALEDSKVYDILGLVYDCYGDCQDVRAAVADQLNVEASITLQATQDNCGFNFSIDATQSVSLEMKSYLNDYMTENAIYVEGSDYAGSAYFKIVATSTVPIDHMNILKLDDSVSKTDGGDENNVLDKYVVVDCPAGAIPSGERAICFSIKTSDLYVAYGPDAILTININAEVELSYTSAKRDNGLSTNYQLHSSVHVVPNAANNNVNSAMTPIIAMSSLFIMNLL